ncbi:MAG TPA: MotA/TolQ/ExbB proton channel family protein [Methylomusa anaerophila]|uniref:Colicin uptake protein TolQ n=1 Tax=Methylomusa anaerophila TaxID=1930071 RepID=A0A348AM31_9FIRM|nr:MotA/TolQ/ExbB proton channel family protein [Methylomusa anaerophila]BBB92129.1 colicin uptake protein TolQ [Methylomusa anaerophila]HML87857.1 MotA/TolQ/ExbB proton channel family protein [Methylomusa anaerophila]
MEFLSQGLSLFHKGGPVMYLLAVCSLAVVAITVERFLYFRSQSADTQDFLAKLEPLLERQRLSEAAQLCEQTPGIVGQVAAQGIQTYQRGGNMESALEGAATLAAARLREYLNYLSAVVTLSPLLGLLGTVIGMISSFSVLNVKSGQPMAITGGVGEALVATAAGLSVAVLAFMAHTYFTHRLDQLVTDVEQTGMKIINCLTAKKPLRRETHEIA